MSHPLRYRVIREINTAHSDAICKLIYICNGSTLVLASLDYSVCFWDVTSGRLGLLWCNLSNVRGSISEWAQEWYQEVSTLFEYYILSISLDLDLENQIVSSICDGDAMTGSWMHNLIMNLIDLDIYNTASLFPRMYYSVCSLISCA